MDANSKEVNVIGGLFANIELPDGTEKEQRFLVVQNLPARMCCIVGRDWQKKLGITVGGGLPIYGNNGLSKDNGLLGSLVTPEDETSGFIAEDLKFSLTDYRKIMGFWDRW